jgi:hypothetical protein
VTRGFMGPLGGFWPKLGRKRVTGWKQRSCVPPGRVKTNKQTLLLLLLGEKVLVPFSPVSCKSLGILDSLLLLLLS